MVGETLAPQAALQSPTMDDEETSAQVPPEVVRPPTLGHEARLWPVSIRTRHHAWNTWAMIAIDHENFAAEAREAAPVDELRPALVAITAAAFALDAFYDVAGNYVDAAVSAKSSRGAKVAERLKRGVGPGKLAQDWPERIQALFELRREAVHSARKSWNPSRMRLSARTSIRATSVGASKATGAVDLLLEVLTGWADHPSAASAPWADSNRPLVTILMARRAQASK
jgi:hypothetical protein